MGPGTTKLLLGNILIGDRLYNIRASDEQVGGILKSENSRGSISEQQSQMAVSGSHSWKDKNRNGSDTKQNRGSMQLKDASAN